MITKSAEETITFGEDLAKHLKPNGIIALIGELGSGKTTLTKGIAKGLGVKDSSYVNSPSFVLIREYKGKIPLYHFDLYRLDNPLDTQQLGLEEYFYSGGICVIEWAEKIKGLLPKEYMKINIHILNGNSRDIKLKAIGRKYKGIRKYLNDYRD